MRYFEDFQLDDKWQFDSWSVTEEEAIAFAQEYDPQPIHTDPVAARKTHFGGIIVSGWQTTLKCIRRFVDGVMKDTAGLASPGLDELSWLQPLKPNQTVQAGARVLKIKASASKPDRGMVWIERYAKNTEGEKIMVAKGLFFIAKRPTV